MNEPLIEFREVDFAYGPGRPVLARLQLLAAARRARGPAGAQRQRQDDAPAPDRRPAAAHAGRIEAFGQQRGAEADFHEVRRRVGLLFQDADDQLFCPTVAEDVAFGPLNLGKPRDEVRRIVAATLESLGLAGYEHRITYHLSGGEKRLVALATVLAMQPDVLLLDEPNGELDDAARSG